MTVTTQYSVPAKYTMPAANPRAKAREAGRFTLVATDTTSGARAIQANAADPNLGKLAMNRPPERSASA
jgi:hypothetical protein